MTATGASPGALRTQANDRVLLVVDDQPLEAFRLAVARMQRRTRAVEVVQIPDQFLHAKMRLVLQQIPVERARLAPLAALRELLSHEQQLLARDSPT